MYKIPVMLKFVMIYEGVVLDPVVVVVDDEEVVDLVVVDDEEVVGNKKPAFR
jgi:hypothetical protein